VRPSPHGELPRLLPGAALAVDALIGYSLRGAPRGTTAEMIDACNRHASRVLSLDVPSGIDATLGSAPGVSVTPDWTLTLALPKTGLVGTAGDLYLADIGIPPAVYERIGIPYQVPFQDRYWVRLLPEATAAC
jgi:NAD(P)H-hydrate epimerase